MIRYQRSLCDVLICLMCVEVEHVSGFSCCSSGGREGSLLEFEQSHGTRRENLKENTSPHRHRTWVSRCNFQPHQRLIYMCQPRDTPLDSEIMGSERPCLSISHDEAEDGRCVSGYIRIDVS
jgi:hypothetical protein